MSKKIFFAAILAACAAHVASAETWYWSPTDGSNWNNANNWTNTAAARGFPHAGDTAVLGWGVAANTWPYYVCGYNSSYTLHELRIEGNQAIHMNQGNLYLSGGGGGVQYLRNEDLVGNYMGMTLEGDGEVPINIAYNVSYGFQMRMLKGSGNPTLVKTGPGKFICFNEANARSYTIPLTLIRQGSFDITTATALDGVTIAFDGDDTSQRLYYCYRANDLLDLQLNNIGFYETNGVANTTHGISSRNDKQVKFTGTPKQNPTVFSGKFYSKAGLNWAPSSASYTFVCSNAVSGTTGSMIVTKGTVKLVTGASFTALKLLSVAAGAIFEVEEGAGANFHADTLTLADATAQLKLGEGVALEMGAATLKGNALPRGTYSSDGSNGTRRAAWIDGAGTVVVVNGPDNVDTWSGAGTDDLTSTDANWASEAAPDVTAGDLLATFATGGTEAELPAGTAAAFEGLVLDSANLGGNAFAFTAGSGATAAIGASGFSVPASSAATTWTMGWPIAISAAQTWNVGANNTVKFNAPLSGDKALTITGGGMVELNATSTHSGALTVDSGTVKVTANNALGTSSRTVQYHYDTARLIFDGDVTMDAPINGTWISADNINNGFTVAAGANVRFNRRVTFYSLSSIELGTGSTTTLAGGLTVNSSGMDGNLLLRGNGTLIVTNTALTIVQKIYSQNNSTMKLDLRVPNNQMRGRYWSEFPSATVLTRVENAFKNNTCLYLGAAGTFDMCGKNQELELQHGIAGAMVKSDAPARLTLLSSSSPDAGSLYDGDSRINRTMFVGQVSVEKRGSIQHTLAAVSSSTGTLKVTQGTLTMGAAASWVNCTNVVVAGGTFAVKNAGAFGAPAQGERSKLFVDVAASGATLNLDYTGNIECQEIRLAGVKQYGTFGAVGSGAENEVAWITGTGTIRALQAGTWLILR